MPPAVSVCVWVHVSLALTVGPNKSRDEILQQSNIDDLK